MEGSGGDVVIRVAVVRLSDLFVGGAKMLDTKAKLVSVLLVPTRRSALGRLVGRF